MKKIIILEWEEGVEPNIDQIKNALDKAMPFPKGCEVTDGLVEIADIIWDVIQVTLQKDIELKEGAAEEIEGMLVRGEIVEKLVTRLQGLPFK